ncbi:MAG TPA: hypothetical protein VI583_02955 [Cyclobacteriaceae bacterium]|nr:hypothetical protein [Cyclobacteriaceae bacterium]
MKNILLMLTVILFHGSANAQDNNILKNTVRAGIYGGFYGYRDIYLPVISAEYSHSFNKNLAIVPRITRSVIVIPGIYPWDYKSSFAASVSLRTSPFPGWFSRVKLDLGGFYHRFKSGHGLVDYYGGPLDLFDIKNTGGLIGAVNFNFIEKNRLEAGFRAELLTNIAGGYFKCESALTGAYLGMKF